MRRMEPAVKLGDPASARRVAGVEIVAIVGTGLLFGVPIALFIMHLLIDAVVGAALLLAVGGGAWWWHHWRTYQAMKVAQMLTLGRGEGKSAARLSQRFGGQMLLPGPMPVARPRPQEPAAPSISLHLTDDQVRYLNGDR